jgi:aspartate aminotransferase
MFEEGDRLRRIHGPEHVYDFTLGNPDLEPPDCVTKRLQALTQDPVPGMHRYMSNAGYQETRSAIAAHVGRNAGLSLTENHVVMTVGAGGGLNGPTILNRAIVIANAPYFVGMDSILTTIKAVGCGQCPPIFSSISRPSPGDYLRTRAVLINSPNNRPE